MGKSFIVANWKSNKTGREAKEWIETISKHDFSQIESSKEIIICPSFTLLPLMKDFIKNSALPFKLGAQDVSQFGEGAYTGAVNADQIKEFCEYVLINHSERRKHFSESEAVGMEKAKIAHASGLKIIFCADNSESLVPENTSVLVYEPPTSISPAPADTPQNANQKAQELSQKTGIKSIIYGGNVTSQNVSSFTQM